jgi:hypothetical protein
MTSSLPRPKTAPPGKQRVTWFPRWCDPLVIPGYNNTIPQQPASANISLAAPPGAAPPGSLSSAPSAGNTTVSGNSSFFNSNVEGCYSAVAVAHDMAWMLPVVLDQVRAGQRRV